MENQYMFQCEICEKILKSKETYITHKSLVHGRMKGRQDFKKCNMCNWRFTTFLQLKHHSSGVHQVEIPWPYFCKLCDQGFEEQMSYDEHKCDPAKPSDLLYLAKPKVKRIKLDYQDSYHCEICQKVFMSKETYVQHRKIAHELSLSNHPDL